MKEHRIEMMGLGKNLKASSRNEAYAHLCQFLLCEVLLSMVLLIQVKLYL